MNPVLLIGLGAVALMATGKKKSSKSTSKKPCPPLSPGGGHIAGFDYIEIATGGASLNERLPIIIHFHSLGSKPESFIKYYDNLPQKARVILPTGREKFGSGPAWWTLKSRTEDQEGLARMMSGEGASMAEFVREVNRCLAGVGKPIITGHSQGGMMTYAVAASAPDDVKGAVAVSGWLPTSMWPQSLPPTFAIHGEDDRTVKFARTEDFIQRASGAGLPITWIPIPGRAHGFSAGIKDAWNDSLQSFLQG